MWITYFPDIGLIYDDFGQYSINEISSSRWMVPGTVSVDE